MTVTLLPYPYILELKVFVPTYTFPILLPHFILGDYLLIDAVYTYSCTKLPWFLLFSKISISKQKLKRLISMVMTLNFFISPILEPFLATIYSAICYLHQRLN